MTEYSTSSTDVDAQPFSPFNAPYPISGQKNRTPMLSKQNNTEKKAIEVLEMRLSDDVLDVQLAIRLASTAVEQFLFFTNQIPFPVTKLAQAQAANEKVVKKRLELVSSLEQLLRDIKTAISIIMNSEESTHTRRDSFHLVITIGSLAMPRATMLFKTWITQHQSNTCLYPDTQQSDVIAEKPEPWSDAPPPDSDSDSDSDVESVDERSSVQLNGKTSPAPPTSFVPFNDNHEERPTLLQNPSPPNALTPLQPRYRSGGPELGLALSDQNSNSNIRIQKLHNGIIRDLIVGISNMDTFTNELEINKISIYVCAPRGFEQEGWHPRPSAAKTLDTLISYPEIEAAALSKIAKMNVCAVKVSGNTRRQQQTQPSLADSEESIWLEWDGKLHGVD
ncbi:hypothetical protein FRC17_003986 [Serendipita sp. 399]|nr:hypothetical protein FRC17_003986 [Serendipita sp. 399]